jgi:hypothetical protein
MKENTFSKEEIAELEKFHGSLLSTTLTLQIGLSVAGP